MSCAATCVVDAGSFDLNAIFDTVKKQLAERGIDFEALCCPPAESAAGDGSAKAKVKVVCVAPNLKESVEEMGQAARDQVVMVRVDEETAEVLDAWVETGAVKSRSEAAALFIRAARTSCGSCAKRAPGRRRSWARGAAGTA